MTFFDKVEIRVKSGKGGDGLVAARKEAGTPWGGPAGGNGGDGGDVIIRASKDRNTLIDLRKNKVYTAMDGENGRAKEQYGANATPIYLEVPVGTIVKDADSGMIIHQFLEDHDEYLLAKGGRGGIGNMHFKNAINQYPSFALNGEPGQERTLILELQLLGDVGLIGTPSVGKSTLINSVSNVKAKTAAYHFTTLVPNLGSVKSGDYSFNMVDIPGLIEGASEGKGLGNEFLKHVLKSQIFAFVIDISQYEQGITEHTTIIDEILNYIVKRFSHSKELGLIINDISFVLELTKKSHIKLIVQGIDIEGETHVIFEKIIHFVVNKWDLVNDEEVIEEYKEQLAIHMIEYFVQRFSLKISKDVIFANMFVVSAATKHGIDQWLHYISDILRYEDIKHFSLIDKQTVEHETFERMADITAQEKQILIDANYIQEKPSKNMKVWKIQDPEFSRLTYQLPWGNEEAMMWFWKVVNKEGFGKLFEKYGVYPGDVLKVKSYYAGMDDRYIMYGV